jgi:DNA-directed RNA polymerase specialized sigma24 family protein
LPRPDLSEPALRRAAFRDVHGARLHGFALLVSLGDRPRAARAAAEALEEGVRRSAELRHPERAAAWLRARVLRSLRRGSPPRAGPGDRERRAVLRSLGAADPVFEGLAALPVVPRAALVASTVERFDPIDVETILGMQSGSSLRTVARARQRYVTAVTTAVHPQELADAPGGELGDRIRAVAGRAIGTPTSVAR